MLQNSKNSNTKNINDYIYKCCCKYLYLFSFFFYEPVIALMTKIFEGFL